MIDPGPPPIVFLEDETTVRARLLAAFEKFDWPGLSDEQRITLVRSYL